MPDDRIILGAAALPEPERAWLAAAERLPIESIWQGGHILPGRPTGEAITRLVAAHGLDGAGASGHGDPAAAPLSPGDRSQAARRPRCVVRRSGLGRRRRRRRVPRRVRRRGRVPRRARSPDRRGHGGAAGAVDRQAGHPPRTVLRSGRRAAATGRPAPAAGRRLARATPHDAGRRPTAAGLRTQGTGHASGRPTGRRLDALPHVPAGLCPTRCAPSATRPSASGGTSTGSSGCSICTARCAPTATAPATTWPASWAGPTATSPAPCWIGSRPSGTPDEVAARLQEYVDAGVRHFIVSPATPEDSFEVVRLAAQEVLPQLVVR